jgi:anti-sigma factor RsiW
MRTCTEYQARISALLDGELSAAERAEVEAHLAGCDACSAVYEAFAALRLPPEEPPASLHAGIMARVAPARKALRAQRRITRLRTGFAVAASLIVIVGSVLALGRNFFRAGSAAPKAADAPAFQAARVADAAPEANEPSGSAEAPAAAAAGAAAGDGGVLFTEMATADAAEEQAAEKGPAQAEAQNDAEIP